MDNINNKRQQNMRRYAITILEILIVILVEMILMLGCYCKRAGISNLKKAYHESEIINMNGIDNVYNKITNTLINK